ncbi:MAG TPA: universal stress protein [Rhizomicrobium sp.]|nr:universal stress protein [Rhizomicrobium sp.]
MDYKTIMVHLELAMPNAGLFAVAGDIAAQLGAAQIIGIAGCQPVQLVYGDTYVSGEIAAADREQVESELTATEQRFREAFKGQACRVEMRSNVTCGPLADYIACEARAADLVITGPDIGGSMFDQARRVKVADLVFQAGRPVLLVPKNCNRLDFEHLMIGWKETSECRRATMAALPLLKLARRVSVLTIAAEEDTKRAGEEVADVVQWLVRHGVLAEGRALAHRGDDVPQFARLMQETAPGLVVAGAYGHGRLREWVLGGVTGDVLINPDRPVLLFH